MTPFGPCLHVIQPHSEIRKSPAYTVRHLCFQSAEHYIHQQSNRAFSIIFNGLQCIGEVCAYLVWNLQALAHASHRRLNFLAEDRSVKARYALTEEHAIK